MNGAKLFATLLLCLFALGGCAGGEVAASPEIAASSEESLIKALKAGEIPPTLQCIYEEPSLFLTAVAQPRTYELSGRPEAGMIPHHLLASDMIAGFFALAAAYDYDRVLLVAPSHYPELCGSDVVTAAAHWQTPYGLLEGDEEIPAALLANPIINAESSPEALERDHGVAGLMSFVKHYLPETKVAAVLLSGRLSSERLDEVIAALEPLCADGRTLLVASVDCSHYLSPEEAALHDAETIKAVESFDYGRIARFGDSNIDSPQSLTLLLRLSQKRGLTLTRLDHSSSAEKLPQGISHNIYQDGITTYLAYASTKKPD